MFFPGHSQDQSVPIYGKKIRVIGSFFSFSFPPTQTLVLTEIFFYSYSSFCNNKDDRENKKLEFEVVNEREEIETYTFNSNKHLDEGFLVGFLGFKNTHLDVCPFFFSFFSSVIFFFFFLKMFSFKVPLHYFGACIKGAS